MRLTQADRKAPLITDALTADGKLQIRGAGGDVVGPGWVVGYHFDGADGDVVIMYDSTTASGTPLLDERLGVDARTTENLPLEDWRYFETGLYADVAASGSRLIIYYKLEE